MAKHRTKKRNMRKRIKKNVQKIKEITAEDILRNPILVESPQFKALPLERQFQLMAQVKQLKGALGTRNMTVSHPVGGGDSSLLTRLNEMNNKIARQENENQQLKTSIEASTKSYKREKELLKEIKRKEQEEKDKIDQAARLDDLEQQLHRLTVLSQNTKVNKLKEQIHEKKKESNYEQLKELRRENIKLRHELDTVNKSIQPNK